MQVDDFPDHLKNLFDGMQDREEAEKRQKEIDKSTCKVGIMESLMNSMRSLCFVVPNFHHFH